jgi:hypothetical protein
MRYKCVGVVCATLLQTLFFNPRCIAETPVAEAAKSHASHSAGSAEAEPAVTLVREVVYNELHDHDTHGYWRYWVEKHHGNESSLQQQIESTDGPVTRTVASNGKPLPTALSTEEDQHLARLLDSPSEQAEHRKAYAEDEHRIGRILALLPDAFLYQQQGDQRLDNVLCHHFRFQPNPDYPAHSIEARIFHAMNGELWIAVDSKRLVRLDGQLQENVDFGYGILGRLYKGGWFRLERTEVGTGGGFGDWKTQRLEVHMQGRAMLFKTIARETSEVRGGFTPIPPLSLPQAVSMARAANQMPGGLGQGTVAAAAIAASVPHSQTVSLQHR